MQTIAIPSKRYGDMAALVDDADYESLSAVRWCVLKGWKTFYAYRTERGETFLMHRVIMAARDGFQVDHMDGNGLHNYRSNLREVTVAVNQQGQSLSAANTSGHKGVSLNRKSGKWYAYIGVGGVLHSLGLHTTIDEAIAARKAGEMQYWD